MTERQRIILLKLRHGRMDHYQIAADMVEAPFTIRAELKTLKRDRLVREHISPDGHLWELTGNGERLAWASGQQQLVP